MALASLAVPTDWSELVTLSPPGQQEISMVQRSVAVPTAYLYFSGFARSATKTYVAHHLALLLGGLWNFHKLCLFRK